MLRANKQTGTSRDCGDLKRLRVVDHW